MQSPRSWRVPYEIAEGGGIFINLIIQFTHLGGTYLTSGRLLFFIVICLLAYLTLHVLVRIQLNLIPSRHLIENAEEMAMVIHKKKKKTSTYRNLYIYIYT